MNEQTHNKELLETKICRHIPPNKILWKSSDADLWSLLMADGFYSTRTHPACELECFQF